MATIYSKKGMLYLGYYVLDTSGNKKHIQFSLKLEDSRENRKLAKIIKTEKEAELLKPNPVLMRYNLNLENAFNLFKKSKRDVSRCTILNYDNMYRYLKLIVNPKTHIKDISKHHIQAFEDYLRYKIGLAHNTVSSYFKDLNTFWNWMIREKFVYDKIPWRIPQEQKLIKTIPDGDFQLILDHLEQKKDKKHFRFVMFLRLSGLRVGEATSLRWEDIDFEKDRILIKNTKGKRNDEFPLYYGLKEFLLRFRQLSGKVFDFKDKDSTKFWNRALEEIEELEGRKYNLHQIRKTFATQLVNKSVSVFDAMKLLRHKNINTTLKYYTYADLNRLGGEANKVFGKLGLLNGSEFCNNTPQTTPNSSSGGSEKVLKLVKIKEN